MSNRYLFATAILALVATVGCIRTPGGIAASNTPIGARSYKVLGEAYGTDTQVALFGIIPVSGPNSMQAAIEDAKTKSGGDALVDVTVEGVAKYFILFSTYTTEVRGKAIKYQ
jgi:hypothetical protein